MTNRTARTTTRGAPARARRSRSRDPLREWTALAPLLREQIARAPAARPRAPAGAQGWTACTYVHHVVEANLVAANLVLAALGRPGVTFDWSWMVPNGEWQQRLRYDQAPLEPAIALFERLAEHLAGLVRRAPGGLARHVMLLDAPGAKLRRRTVAQLLLDEVDHARGHLRELDAAGTAAGAGGR